MFSPVILILIKMMAMVRAWRAEMMLLVPFFFEHINSYKGY